MHTIVRELVDAATRPVLGIGVGTPGVVDAAGVVVDAPNLGWHGTPLAEGLRAAFDVPVFVANDANTAVLGEHTFGDAGDGVLPSFPGTTVPTERGRPAGGGPGRPVPVRRQHRRRAGGRGGVHGDDPSAAPDAVIAVDEEGGDVTRLHVPDGSPVLGPLALGAADDPALTQAVGRAIGIGWPRWASPSTSARSPTSTPTPTTR